MKKIHQALLALTLTTSFSTLAADTLRYGVESQYPPFESRNTRGDLEGFDIDLGNAICQAAQLQCRWVESSFDALIPGLAAKKFDAINSAMNITAQRMKSIAFTRPIYRIPSQLVGRQGAGMQPTAAGLQGKQIGVLQGSIQETYAKRHWEPKGVSIVAYQDQNQIYNDMVAGRLDGTLVMSAAGQSGFLSKPQGNGFGFIGEPVEDDAILGSGIGFGLRKGDAALKAKLDAAIAGLQQSGEVTKLAERYFPGIDVSVKP
ncbi:transporter substrate-binding domain-containing protein [Pantoea sp. 1.19]|uniref:transporter substrate-binding domain-containing protein n=1 Tax=Pantoea sp. 1.19 TaxID=1925589 RepID=UPI000948CB54|nr:transporter substrate-binding domain-containing protein [Pantoea sp. 1.19]